MPTSTRLFNVNCADNNGRMWASAPYGKYQYRLLNPVGVGLCAHPFGHCKINGRAWKPSPTTYANIF